MTILFLNFHITISDIRPHIKWAASLVVALVALIFLRWLCGYVWVNGQQYHVKQQTSIYITIIYLLLLSYLCFCFYNGDIGQSALTYLICEEEGKWQMMDDVVDDNNDHEIDDWQK